VPPRSPTATEQLGVFLARSILTVKIGLCLCGVGWLTMACWVAFTRPDRFGPARVVAALALLVATATCPVVWWLARSWQRWLMVVLTEIIPHQRDSGDPAGNLRSLTDTGRR
jgi:hypothetical protein